MRFFGPWLSGGGPAGVSLWPPVVLRGPPGVLLGPPGILRIHGAGVIFYLLRLFVHLFFRFRFSKWQALFVRSESYTRARKEGILQVGVV